MNQAFQPRRTTVQPTRVVASNTARREKHHRMEMFGILQIDKLTKLIGNSQCFSSVSLFFLCGHELTSRKYSLPSASVSAARHPSLSVHGIHVLKKKDKIMIEIHIKNMKDTPEPLTVQKRSSAPGSLSTSAKCFYMVELRHLSVWVPAHLHFNILD